MDRSSAKLRRPPRDRIETSAVLMPHGSTADADTNLKSRRTSPHSKGTITEADSKAED